MSDMRRVGLKLLLSDDDARRLRQRAVQYERTLEGQATWLIKCALEEMDDQDTAATAMQRDIDGNHQRAAVKDARELGQDAAYAASLGPEMTTAEKLASRLGSEDTP